MPDIAAKVAAVLNDRRLVVNLGSVGGVNEGDSVLLWNVVEVTDPDTGELLGVVKSPKLVLTVDEVQERIAVAAVPSEAINFSQMLFNAKPGKKIATTGSTSGDSVRVEVGEEVTVRLAVAPDKGTPAP